MRPECWLGDLVSAVTWFERRGMHMDPERLLAIARMLGCEQLPGGRLAAAPVAGSVVDYRDDATTEPEPTAQVTVIPLPFLSTVKQPDTQGSLPPSMPLPEVPLAKAEIARISNPRPYEPLLTPQSSRATLQTALQRSVPDGPPDVRRLAELVARRDRLPAELPKIMVPTLRYGAQVLCDVAERMDPFRRDQDELVNQLRKLLGAQRTDERWFEGSPLGGCSRGARGEWGDYPLPEPGRPVLVLSSFGLGYGSGYFETRREWGDLVALLRRRDCAVIALVPVPPARWPRWLVRLMPLICWDRSTTASSVAVAVRRAR